MYTILSKSEGVPFKISFFWGDLTWNDPICNSNIINVEMNGVKLPKLTTFLYFS